MGHRSGAAAAAVVAAALALAGLSGPVSSPAAAASGRIQGHRGPAPARPSVCIVTASGGPGTSRTAGSLFPPTTQSPSTTQPPTTQSPTTQPSTSASGNVSVVIPAVAIVRVEGRTLRVTTNTGEPPAATDDFTVVGPGAGHTVSPQEERRIISACARPAGR